MHKIALWPWLAIAWRWRIVIILNLLAQNLCAGSVPSSGSKTSDGSAELAEGMYGGATPIYTDRHTVTSTEVSSTERSALPVKAECGAVSHHQSNDDVRVRLHWWLRITHAKRDRSDPMYGQ